MNTPKPGPKLKALIQVENQLESMIDSATVLTVDFEDVIKEFFKKNPLNDLGPDDVKFLRDRINNSAHLKHIKAGRVRDSADALTWASSLIEANLCRHLEALPEKQMAGETWTAKLIPSTPRVIIESIEKLKAFDPLIMTDPTTGRISNPNRVMELVEKHNEVPGIQIQRMNELEFILNKKTQP